MLNRLKLKVNHRYLISLNHMNTRTAHIISKEFFNRSILKTDRLMVHKLLVTLQGLLESVLYNFSGLPTRGPVTFKEYLEVVSTCFCGLL